MVSVLVTSMWAGSHVGLVTGPSFSQAPLQFHSCNPFREEKFCVRFVTVGCPLPHFMPCLPAGGGLYQLPLPTVGHFIKCPFLLVLRVSHPSGLCFILESTPNILSPEVACFYSFCWPSGLQSFALSQYQIRFPTSPCLPLFLQDPSLHPHLWLLFFPSQVGLICAHMGTSVCWPFRVLWLIYTY